jgi:hypothetical protein
LSGRWSTFTPNQAEFAVLKRSLGWIGVAVAVFGALIALVIFWPESEPRVVVDHTLPASAPEDVAATLAPGSLAVTLPQVTERWNEVDLPSRIDGGLIIHPESGRLDSFTFHFNESSLIAGAYDPENEYVYALMASSWLSDEAASHFGQHLCHLTQPYSQECIDDFQQVGLAGQPLSSYVDVTYESSWMVGEHTWRINIAENIQTIRVIGPEGG